MVDNDNELIIEERDTDLETQGFYLYIDEDNFITGYSSSRVPDAPFIPTEKLPNQDVNTDLLLYRYEGGELIFDDSKINQMIEDREQAEEDERLAEIEKEQAVANLKEKLRIERERNQKMSMDVELLTDVVVMIMDEKFS